MKLDTVIAIGKEIRDAYDWTDPEDLCRTFGIIRLLYPMGTAKKSVKGFILKHNGKIAITVNSDLSEAMKNVVLYHELAHYILHVRTGLSEAIHDADVYDAVSEAEYEANLLAAELSVEDADALEALRDTGDFYAAAGTLCIPWEVLAFKVRILRAKGFDLPEPPARSEGTYLHGFSEEAGT